MKKAHSILRVILALALLLNMCPAGIFAEEDPVTSAVTKLNAIDTLQQMQTKRASFDNKEGYQAYLDDMFSKRAEAIAAYGALTDEQKAEVQTHVSDLEDKLRTELPTVWLFQPGTVNITTGAGIYTYQVIFEDFASYEASYHHAVSGDVAQTIMLVDTEKDASPEWKPNGAYEYGKNNYLLTYCCDLVTATKEKERYRRLNLEEADYYTPEAAEHIRAIVQSSYPFVSLDEMKANLAAAGFENAEQLNRGEIIAAVQMAIWRYANAEDDRVTPEKLAETTHDKGYFNYSKVNWCNPYHDYRNEVWDWWKTTSASTEDPVAAAKIDALTEFIYKMDGVKAAPEQIVISDIEILNAQLISEEEGVYQMQIEVSLNGVSRDGGDVTLTAVSASGAPVTQKISATKDTYVLTLQAKDGDEISVTADGTQILGKGVYFYDPQDGKNESQCLVGMAEGSTKVHAEKSVTWENLDPEPVPEEPEPTPKPDPKPDPKPEPTPEPDPVPEETIPDEETPQTAPEEGIEETEDLTPGKDELSPLEEEELEEEQIPLTPFTGDERNTGLWTLAAVLSLLGIAAIAAGGKRRAK